MLLAAYFCELLKFKQLNKLFAVLNKETITVKLYMSTKRILIRTGVEPSLVINNG